MNTLKFGNGEWYGKKDTILAYNDLNSNFKPLPFSFDRASSATRINKDGLIETVGSGEPRIDYKDDSKGALLLEPSRTNLVTYSEDFTHSSWIKIGVTATLSNSISPDGTLNAYRFYASSAAENTRLYSNITFSAATYTFSVYAKKNGTNDKFKFSISDSSGQTLTPDFNLTDNWKRFEYTYTSSGGSGNWWVVNPSSAELGSEFDVLIYGAQVEQGSYATSYIPTQGSIGTRNSDSCSQTPPSGIIGQTEGSIYSEFKCLDSITNLILWMRDGSGGNYTDMIKLEVNSSNVFRLEIRESNGNSANITSSALTVGNYYKVAVGYKQNDYVVYINGVQIGTDGSGNVPTCSEMYIGKYIDGGIRMGVSKDLKLYNTRLSNAELQALTTL